MSEYGSNASITGTLSVDGETDIGTGDDNVDLDAGTLYIDAGQDRVGIGTESPDYELDVAGDMGVDEFIYHNGDDDTFVKFTDDVVILKAGGKSILRGDPDNSNGQILINNGGHDLDLVVKNAATGTLLYTDAGNARVGIGTDAPDYTLDVAGNIGVDEYIYHNADTNTYIRFQGDDINLQAGGKSMIKLDEGDGIVKVNNGNNDIDFRIKDDHADVLFHADAANSNIGIGIASPSTSAILEMSSSNKGVLLPRVLAASKPTATSALNGLMVYEEDTHRLKIVADGEWHTIKYDE